MGEESVGAFNEGVVCNSVGAPVGFADGGTVGTKVCSSVGDATSSGDEKCVEDTSELQSGLKMIRLEQWHMTGLQSDHPWALVGECVGSRVGVCVGLVVVVVGASVERWSVNDRRAIAAEARSAQHVRRCPGRN